MIGRARGIFRALGLFCDTITAGPHHRAQSRTHGTRTTQSDPWGELWTVGHNTVGVGSAAVTKALLWRGTPMLRGGCQGASVGNPRTCHSGLL